MNRDLKKRIMEYMKTCTSCTIATATKDGEPGASTVFFKNRGMDIYFNTGSDTQKVRNIKANPRVAITMQTAGSAPRKDREIKGIQYTGKGTILTDKDTSEVPRAVMARHRAFNSALPGKSVIVRVVPSKIYLINYSRGFRHRDLLEIS